MLASRPSAIIAKALKHKGRKLVFIIGNGFHPVDSILREEDFQAAVNKRYGKKAVASWKRERFDQERWKYLEYTRFVTKNITPSLSYFLLNYVINERQVKAVITSNYDLYFNSIFDRTNKSPDAYCFNPAIGDGDYDWEGYYSKKTAAKADAVRIFKIHGSLSHAVFRDCRRLNNQLHIFRLPSFIVGFDTGQIRRQYKVKYLHDYLGHVGIKCGDITLIDDEKQTGYYVHYMDWATKHLSAAGSSYRDFFSKEIEGAKAELADTANVGAVVIIGFTGYYDPANPRDEYNEELSPVIETLVPRVPVFHFLREDQYDSALRRANALYLWNAVKGAGSDHVATYDDTGRLMLDLICGRQLRLRRRLEAQYQSDWVSANLFMNPSLL